MAGCERCWGDAFSRSYGTGRSQAECYQEILLERKDNPCSPRDQAGQFWDEENQCDIRDGRRKENSGFAANSQTTTVCQNAADTNESGL